MYPSPRAVGVPRALETFSHTLVFPAQLLLLRLFFARALGSTTRGLFGKDDFRRRHHISVRVSIVEPSAETPPLSSYDPQPTDRKTCQDAVVPTPPATPSLDDDDLALTSHLALTSQSYESKFLKARVLNFPPVRKGRCADEAARRESRPASRVTTSVFESTSRLTT